MAKQPSENPTYKLTYFNLKGLGEPIRLLFIYGGIKFENVRINTEDWPTVKPTMPMGQLPVLEVDGIPVYQSNAIGRYVAKQVGLAGTNSWEDLQIDIAVDTVNDFRLKLSTVFWEQDEAIKQKKSEELKKDVIPFYLEKLDAIAKENNGYLALGRLTWADTFLLGILDYVNLMIEFNLADKYPNLGRVITNVSNVSSIKAWLEERPKDQF